MEELASELQCLVQSLQDLIQCPVCLNSLDPAHSQCENGHGVCSTCKSKIRTCPMCSSKFVLHRATILNQVIEQLPKLCPHICEGCSKIVFSTHDMFCQFRPTVCKMKDCQWQGRVSGLANHLEAQHPLYFFKFNNNSMNRMYVFSDLLEDTFSYTPLEYKGKLFWKYYFRNGTTKLICHKFYYVPTEKPTHDYYFTISFKKDMIEYTCTSKACIFTDEDAGTDTLNENSGLVISDSELSIFLAQGETCKYNYSIKVIEKMIEEGG